MLQDFFVYYSIITFIFCTGIYGELPTHHQFNFVRAIRGHNVDQHADDNNLDWLLSNDQPETFGSSFVQTSRQTFGYPESSKSILFMPPSSTSRKSNQYYSEEDSISSSIRSSQNVQSRHAGAATGIQPFDGDLNQFRQSFSGSKQRSVNSHTLSSREVHKIDPSIGQFDINQFNYQFQESAHDLGIDIPGEGARPFERKLAAIPFKPKPESTVVHSDSDCSNSEAVLLYTLFTASIDFVTDTFFQPISLKQSLYRKQRK